MPLLMSDAMFTCYFCNCRTDVNSSTNGSCASCHALTQPPSEKRIEQHANSPMELRALRFSVS
eukprot:4202820-Amphidinium_carterae.1